MPARHRLLIEALKRAGADFVQLLGEGAANSFCQQGRHGQGAQGAEDHAAASLDGGVHEQHLQVHADHEPAADTAHGNLH